MSTENLFSYDPKPTKITFGWLVRKLDLFGYKFMFEEDDNQTFRTII